MSLLSVDITKAKKLPLKKVKLSQEEEKAEPSVAPYTEEEQIYTELIKVNPLVEDLVKQFNLVSDKTGEPLRKVEKQPLREVDKQRLRSLAEDVLQEGSSQTKEEIIEQIIEQTKVSERRALRGFNLMVEVEAIELTPGGEYYLKNSTPF